MGIEPKTSQIAEFLAVNKGVIWLDFMNDWEQSQTNSIRLKVNFLGKLEKGNYNYKHCHNYVLFERFQRAFTACCCIFKEITLVGSNQRHYFENANARIKRTLKTRVATRLETVLGLIKAY